jgi:hypothetical protein
MGTKRLVSMVVLIVLAALAACEDGGPPNPFRPHLRTRDTPATAADSGTPDAALDPEADDAGADAERGNETSARDDEDEN